MQTGGKHEQVYLGTLVAVGNTWKLIDLPVVGSDQQAPSPFLMAADTPADRAPVNPNAPTEEMQKLMAELERLDKAAEGLPPEQQAANVDQRAERAESTGGSHHGQGLAQPVAPANDRHAVCRRPMGNFPQGVERLDQLEKRLKDAGADEELLAHVAFQRMWAANAVAQAQPNADRAVLQQKWLADLEAFVNDHPKNADSAEALLQLGMFQEFNGKTDDARKWYSLLYTNFPTAAPAKKARGAFQRLSSVGRPLQLRGQSIRR